MTLEEVEKLARDCIHRGGAEYSELEMSQLARALLAVLPVVKAAEAWADSMPLGQQGERLWSLEIEHLSDEGRSVIDAIDTLRRSLAEVHRG